MRLLSLLLLLASGCGEPAAPAEAPPAAPVSVALAELRDVPLLVAAIGTVESPATVVIKPQVAGRIVEIGFEEGDEVAAGDLLLMLDRHPLEAALHVAEANLARDTAMAKDAALQAQQIEAVLQDGLVAKRDAQQVRATADAAQAAAASAQANVELARLRLEYASIRAPIAGRTGMLGARVGSVVKVDETELLTIRQMEPMRVAFSVPQDHLPEIRRRQEAGPLEVEASLADGALVRGRLSFIDNAVDASAGTIRLMATFGNADRRLWPGQYVDVALTVGVDRQTVVVPSRAVQTGQKGTYVFLVHDEGTVEQRAVEVLRPAGEFIAIASGLQAGESVVTDGQLRLVEGARVVVR